METAKGERKRLGVTQQFGAGSRESSDTSRLVTDEQVSLDDRRPFLSADRAARGVRSSRTCDI